ncbi:MAG TPA: phosphate ABC transporter substrate-binding protein PstS [Candidatus Sericytochromatia bacterium]|jgi:phosphate transport system substrate-binding protein
MLLTTAFRRAATVSVATVALSFGSVYAAIAQTVTLNGAGATFPKPLYDRYFDAFKKEANIQVNYEGIGSGGGIKQFIADTVDFAGSDAFPKTDDQGKMAKGVIMVPTAGGAVSVVYNLPGVTNLKLSRSVLPAIFAGEITRWNDPKIAADNAGVNLPNKPIRLAVRSDGSGTTNIFVTHLAATSSSFKSKIPPGSAPTWLGNPLSGKGNPGVAALVQQTEGAIGYVEAAYATQNKLQQAQVQNKANRFVSPTLDEANKALSAIKFNDDFSVSGAEDPADGYPIAGVTWLLIKKQYDAQKADAVKKMVSWILTKGQDINKDLGYTRIPTNVATKAGQAVTSNVAAR